MHFICCCCTCIFHFRTDSKCCEHLSWVFSCALFAILIRSVSGMRDKEKAQSWRREASDVGEVGSRRRRQWKNFVHHSILHTYIQKNPSFGSPIFIRWYNKSCLLFHFAVLSWRERWQNQMQPTKRMGERERRDVGKGREATTENIYKMNGNNALQLCEWMEYVLKNWASFLISSVCYALGNGFVILALRIESDSERWNKLNENETNHITIIINACQNQTELDRKWQTKYSCN